MRVMNDAPERTGMYLQRLFVFARYQRAGRITVLPGSADSPGHDRTAAGKYPAGNI